MCRDIPPGRSSVFELTVYDGPRDSSEAPPPFGPLPPQRSSFHSSHLERLPGLTDTLPSLVHVRPVHSSPVTPLVRGRRGTRPLLHHTPVGSHHPPPASALRHPVTSPTSETVQRKHELERGETPESVVRNQGLPYTHTHKYINNYT